MLLIIFIFKFQDGWVKSEVINQDKQHVKQ